MKNILQIICFFGVNDIIFVLSKRCCRDEKTGKMKIINAPGHANCDFYADGNRVSIIDGKAMMEISERGKADRWEEIPLSKFSPSQQAEIHRLAAWRKLTITSREKIVNARLAKILAAGL